jgi:hypothetical protein
MRFIKEFFNPKLRCERTMHNTKLEIVRIRKSSNEPYEVAADYDARIRFCKRCGCYIGSPFNLNKIQSIQSLSMPTKLANEMEKNGFIII